MPPETTSLPPEIEKVFQNWARQNQLKDVDHPDSHYDYRGFFQDTLGAPHPPGGQLHFPDTFKQHGHPTFSVESKYSRGPQDGGMWLDGTEHQMHLVPSHERNMKTMDPLQQQMMQRAMQSQQDPTSDANMAAHPPMPGAPPPGIAAPGMNKPPMDMTTIQRLLAMLGLNSGGMMGAPAPMGGPGQSGPQAAGGITGAVSNLPGMQGLRKMVGQ